MRPYLSVASAASCLLSSDEGGARPDVIMITADRDITSVRTAMKLGAVGYLVKPFGSADLAERLTAYRELQYGGTAEAGPTGLRRVECRDWPRTEARQRAFAFPRAHHLDLDEYGTPVPAAFYWRGVAWRVSGRAGSRAPAGW